MKALKLVNTDISRNIQKELSIETRQDLRNYVLNEWLKLSQSDEQATRIIALKEMSKYIFTRYVTIDDVLDRENSFNI